MKLIHSKGAVCASLLCTTVLLTSTAQAAIIDFEGFAQPNGAILEIADGVAGFDWLGVHASAPEIVTNKPGGQNTGYHNGVVSGNEIGFAQFGFASISRDDAFTLNSLYLTSAYKNDRTLRITGSAAGGESYLRDVVLGISEPLLVDLDWTGLSAVTFQWLAGSPGTTIPGFPTGDQFVFDDIRFDEPITPVPLPGAAWLLASGVLGLAGAARRRKTTT